MTKRQEVTAKPNGKQTCKILFFLAFSFLIGFSSLKTYSTGGNRSLSNYQFKNALKTFKWKLLHVANCTVNKLIQLSDINIHSY